MDFKNHELQVQAGWYIKEILIEGFRNIRNLRENIYDHLNFNYLSRRYSK